MDLKETLKFTKLNLIKLLKLQMGLVPNSCPTSQLLDDLIL
jgi:hypothetical protein